MPALPVVARTVQFRLQVEHVTEPVPGVDAERRSDAPARQDSNAGFGAHAPLLLGSAGRDG